MSFGYRQAQAMLAGRGAFTIEVRTEDGRVLVAAGEFMYASEGDARQAATLALYAAAATSEVLILERQWKTIGKESRLLGSVPPGRRGF